MLAGVRPPAIALLLLSALTACASAPRAFSDGMTVPVSVVNRTRDTICFLYLSPINDDSWSDDVLGSATVSDGATRTIRVPPGNWDIRIENCQHEGSSILRGARIARGSALVLQ
ncbi:MAG: hypothetical protein JWM10_2189 [Myxococcaceae bacterium]|nr:hypothetical protein [Myxococcaceae bacterium]